jgi:hypothetical protein
MLIEFELFGLHARAILLGKGYFFKIFVEPVDAVWIARYPSNPADFLFVFTRKL